MLGYIKAELYKNFRQKIIYISLIIIFIYALIANIIFLNGNMDITNLYSNFIEEYYLLYVLLILFFISSSVCDEYQYGAFIYYDNKNLFLAKFIIFLLYLLFIIIISFLLSHFISLIIFKKIICIYLIKNLKYVIFCLPMFIILILSSYIFSIIFKKSSYVNFFCYLFFFLSNYLSLNFKSRLIISNSWNLNIVNDKFSCLLVDVLYLFVLIIILFLFLKREKKRLFVY